MASTSGVSYLTYQAPIKGYDRSGVPMVDIARTQAIDRGGLQGIYSSAYTSSGGSRYQAERAVTQHLTSMGVNGNTVNWR